MIRGTCDENTAIAICEWFRDVSTGVKPDSLPLPERLKSGSYTIRFPMPSKMNDSFRDHAIGFVDGYVSACGGVPGRPAERMVI